MISKLRSCGFIFYVVCVIDFFVLPLFSNSLVGDLVIFMVIMPLVCFISSIVYGYQMGMDWHYYIIASLLYTPHLLENNVNTWVYFVIVVACIYVGTLLGNEIGKELEEAK